MIISLLVIECVVQVSIRSSECSPHRTANQINGAIYADDLFENSIFRFVIECSNDAGRRTQFPYSSRASSEWKEELSRYRCNFGPVRS